MINWCSELNTWMIQYKCYTYCSVTRHIVSLESDLFAGAWLFLLIFFLFCIFVFHCFCQETLFFLPPLSIPWNMAETFPFQSSAGVSKSVCVCVRKCVHVRKCMCMCACVRAHQRLTLYVCQAAELRDEDSSLFCSNVRWHLCLPLTQKQNCYLLYPLQRHTNETGGGNALFSQRGSKWGE